MAHGSRVTTSVQPVEPPADPSVVRRGADRDHLGVRRRVAERLAHVVPAPSTAPSGPTTSAPTGTSPEASAARGDGERLAHPRGIPRVDGQTARRSGTGSRAKFRRMRVHVADHPLIAHKLDRPARQAHRLPHLPAAGRRAGDAAGLRGDPRGPRRAVRDRDARRADAAASSWPAPSRWSCRSCAPASACSTAWCGCCRPPRSASSAWSATRRRCEATTYANRLPDDLSGRQCYVLDPMLATGGTLAAAIHYLVDRGADDITAICLLARARGHRAAGGSASPTCDVPVTVVIGAIDERLNEQRLHRPGPRRRRRPPVRRRLSTAYPARARACGDGRPIRQDRPLTW